MHGGISWRTRLTGYPGLGTIFLSWTFIGTLAYMRHHLQNGQLGLGREFVPGLLHWLTCYYPWVVLTPVVFHLERRFPLGSSQWPARLTALALASVPVSLLALPLIALLSAAFGLIVSAPPGKASIWCAFTLGEFVASEAMYWCTVAASSFIRNLVTLRDYERKATRLALEKSQLESSLRQAELEVLRERLNPHFLFNCLQNISTLTQQDPKTASRMLARLGDLLRAVLRRDAQMETTLEAEIALTDAYVAIEKMRFGDRLSVVFRVESKLHHVLVPSFLLQPLVENAIVHGLRGARRGVIVIAATAEGTELVLTVTDNGIGPPGDNPSEMKVGVGISATCERLARMYPEQNTFSIQEVADGGTEVRITLPLRRASRTASPTSNEYAPVADRR